LKVTLFYPANHITENNPELCMSIFLFRKLFIKALQKRTYSLIKRFQKQINEKLSTSEISFLNYANSVLRLRATQVS